MSTEITLRTNTPRPALPKSLLNPLIASIDQASTAVKFQVITREDQDIIVGRLKIPTPAGHAFVLRRFDTGSISVSTMVRAAFPGVTEDVERRETAWVRTAFDCSGANGVGARRLAGVWAPLAVALYLATDYELADIIGPLANASPDPKAIYRRTKSAAENSNVVSSTPASPAPAPVSKSSPSTKATSPPAAKRRRAASPAPAANGTTASLPTLSAETSLPVPRSTRSSASPTRRTRASASPARQSRRKALSTSQSTAIDKPETVSEIDPEEDAHIAGPDHNEDVAEQKALVATLKAAQEAASANSAHVSSVGVKRGLEDETQLTLNIAKHEVTDAAAERPIATNRRIQMTPSRKAAAWGALAFSIGLGAVAFLPNFM